MPVTYPDLAHTLNVLASDLDYIAREAARPAACTRAVSICCDIESVHDQLAALGSRLDGSEGVDRERLSGILGRLRLAASSGQDFHGTVELTGWQANLRAQANRIQGLIPASDAAR